MNKLYIIRHGKTDWNEKNILQGKTDIELNAEGIKQAEELRNIIDISKIDVCLCSPLKRAKQTAEIIVKGNVPIIYDSLLLERDYGDYEGKAINFESIKKQWDYKLNDSSNNIEPICNCMNRAKKFLNKVRMEYSNKNILIISHGGFIKMLHYNLIGYDASTDFLSFSPQNAVVYEYELN